MEAFILSEKLPKELSDLPVSIDTNTAAKLLGITRAGVVKMLERGDLPGFRAGRVWRIRRDDFLKIMGYDEQGE